MISFIIGFILAWIFVSIIASGKFADHYTQGYVDAANHYESLLEEKGLKKNGVWI